MNAAHRCPSLPSPFYGQMEIISIIRRFIWFSIDSFHSFNALSGHNPSQLVLKLV